MDGWCPKKWDCPWLASFWTKHWIVSGTPYRYSFILPGHIPIHSSISPSPLPFSCLDLANNIGPKNSLLSINIYLTVQNVQGQGDDFWCACQIMQNFIKKSFHAFTHALVNKVYKLGLARQNTFKLKKFIREAFKKVPPRYGNTARAKNVSKEKS